MFSTVTNLGKTVQSFILQVSELRPRFCKSQPYHWTREENATTDDAGFFPSESYLFGHKRTAEPSRLW